MCWPEAMFAEMVQSSVAAEQATQTVASIVGRAEYDSRRRDGREETKTVITEHKYTHKRTKSKPGNATL